MRFAFQQTNPGNPQPVLATGRPPKPNPHVPQIASHDARKILNSNSTESINSGGSLRWRSKSLLAMARLRTANMERAVDATAKPEAPPNRKYETRQRPAVSFHAGQC
ncbi:MAG: hypothetical protein ACRETL_02405, partial [Gammaproteobacteria bacterium]